MSPSSEALSHWEVRRAAIGLSIERAALQLFLERGFDAVTVEDMAEAAGISRRTFFRYFRSRDDLLAAMPLRSLLRASQAMRERPARESIVEALVETARAGTVPDEEREIMRLSAEVMQRFPDAWSRALRRLRLETDAVFSEVVAHRFANAGRTPAGHEVIGAGLAAIVVQVYCSWVFGRSPTDSFADQLQQALRQFSHIVQEG